LLTFARLLETIFDTFLDRTHERPVDAGGPGVIVNRLRGRLFYLVPTVNAVLVLTGIVVLSAWITMNFAPSLEAAVLKPLSFLGVRLPLPFDLLLHFTYVAAICGTCWSLWRFVSTWGQLALLLERLDDSPLAGAFSRLPRSMVRSTRIALFDSPALVSISSALADRWPLLKQAASDEQLTTEPEIAQASGPADPPPIRNALYQMTADFDTRFVELYKGLCHQWLKAHGHAADKTPVQKARRRWIKAAEDVVAIFIVDYIEWVFRSLRFLALFLVLSLLLMVVLLATYPIQPESILDAVYYLILGITVLSILSILFRMNREPILSRIAGTDAGVVNWDIHFVMNVVIFGGLPLLTLIGSEFPGARSFLFSWVDPVLRSLGKG